MQVSQQRFLLWTSIVLVIVELIGFVGFMRFIPVPPAFMTPEQVAHMYQTNTFGIRIGSVCVMLGSAAFAFFMAVLAAQIKRIPTVSEAVSSSVMILGGANTLLLLIPGIIWSIAAFRPDRSIEITTTLNDMAWLFGVMPASSFIMIQIAMALACFGDKEERILPRWLGYISLWTALVYVPAFGAMFFKSGPFAWHGLLAFYLATIAGGIWAVPTYITLFKALRNQEQQP